jgi:hypothetical protein
MIVWKRGDGQPLIPLVHDELETADVAPINAT